MNLIPASHADLLERPVFAHLATIRPDGNPHVNPMWFRWNGEHMEFTSTTTRYKYRNMAENPHVAISINDPDKPYRYLELRGIVDRIEPDRDLAFFSQLAGRYSLDMTPGDAPDRVHIFVRPTHATFQ